MFGGAARDFPEKLGFLLIPDFSMIALSAAIEPLRLANRVAGQELYRWSLYSQTGAPVTASNGIDVSVNGDLDAASQEAIIVLCSGINAHLFKDKTVLGWLRRMDRKGADIGGICTGGRILAEAGLLDGKRCTIHWENIASFSEDFPDIEVTAHLFEIDGNRFTAAGGTAVADLMLKLISVQCGDEVAGHVAEYIIHERIRAPDEHQRLSLPARLGVRNPRLLAIIQQMEANLEEPLSRAQLAHSAGLSTRQLERLFRRYLNRSPARYYLELRLHKARLLLLQTNMSVMNVALASGFVSASHFTKCYRAFFGRTPYRERGGQRADPDHKPSLTEMAKVAGSAGS